MKYACTKHETTAPECSLCRIDYLEAKLAAAREQAYTGHEWQRLLNQRDGALKRLEEAQANAGFMLEEANTRVRERDALLEKLEALRQDRDGLLKSFAAVVRGDYCEFCQDSATTPEDARAQRDAALARAEAAEKTIEDVHNRVFHGETWGALRADGINYFRAKKGLPPLSDEEEAKWAGMRGYWNDEDTKEQVMRAEKAEASLKATEERLETLCHFIEYNPHPTDEECEQAVAAARRNP